MKVAILDYGAGNVRSVAFALERLGVDATLTANSENINNADRVIFPVKEKRVWPCKSSQPQV